MLFERPQFRFGQCLHGVPFEVVFADVHHKNHGSLFHREIGGAIAAKWSWMPAAPRQAHFVEPMLLQRVERLAEGGSHVLEVKLDGFRAEAIKSAGRVLLRSRNDKDFNAKYPRGHWSRSAI